MHVNPNPFDPENPNAQRRARENSARKARHSIADSTQANSEDSWRGRRRRHEARPAARHRREDHGGSWKGAHPSVSGENRREPEGISRSRPTGQHFRRRRIAAAMFVAFLLACATGVGAAVQKLSSSRHEDPQAHNTVNEPADYAPTEAVAIPPATPDVQLTPAVARIPQKLRPIRDELKPGQNRELQLKSSDRERKYIINIPRGALPYSKKGNPTAHPDAKTKPLPLIFAFHGYREQADQMARYTGLADKEAIVVYPQGVGNAWEGAPYAKVKRGEDVRFVRDILDAVSSTYQVDANRIYATGMSNGGGFVGKLACELPEEFAAFAAVSAAYYSGTWRACAEKGSDPKRPETVHFKRGQTSPYLDIHGRKDQTIHYDGGPRYEDEYLGAYEFTQQYAARSHCVGAPVTTRVTDAIQRVQWPNCGHGMEVTHLAIGDAGHTWMGERTGEAGKAAADPSRESKSKAVTATGEVAAFFEVHRRS